ncbi:PREDICTED: histone-lysine N-methyltransferase trithorax-like isoform X1 [Papilio polytes]|uniref:histone-lysine N-methyltransferase trithorax-like isoform X1 n=2 Tax=Papilio polytes TaxID=76194 RepID=UPI000675C5F1|nr:PREDICTED: histone-lysine N-methyltransferase trithorax-like isoform X1 [Papilio polytes]
MGRSRFPGKPLKFQNRKRISVLSGTVYHETAQENHPAARSSGGNDFTGEKEEEEKKESNNENEENSTSENKVTEDTQKNKKEPPENGGDLSKSPVRTRSQNKMEPSKSDKPKPVKKTVTFGTVESCEDIFLPLKKVPIKHHAPLVSIIKKKSSLKQTEYSTFNSILKPAKLTDLSSKSSIEQQEGYLRKNLNPLSKPMNKFSQFSESRCISPPPRNISPMDRETGNSKFVLPVRSAHSSRVIKPNKRFIDGEEQSTISSALSSGKVLKKPKLKRLVFNNLHDNDDSPEEDDAEKNENEKNRDKNMLSSSNLFKDKTTNSFSNINTGNRKSLRDLFSFEKDSEYSPDENSNVENLEKAKTNDHKEERTGHAMRKLMDISDASTSPSTSSGSESEDSWESESPAGSGDEEERPASSSPEKDKSTASQLLRGKVIIREARLQLNTTTPSNMGLDGPFSTVAPVSSQNPPTTVTCGVCGAVRFYRFVKQARKFGIYSCESCRKFISKMLKKEKLSHRTGPVVMQCLKGEGNCHVPPIVRSQQWKLLRCTNKTRCPACWLKMCLKAFQVPPNIRASLTAMLPPHMRAGAKASVPITQANPLRIASNTTPQPMFTALATTENENTKLFGTLKVTKKPSEEVEKQEEKVQKETKEAEEANEDFSNNRKRRLTRVKVRKKDKSDGKQTEDPKRQKMELKGPRVKHVCRSASIVLGQPIATFPTQEEKDKPSLSSDDDSTALPVDKENGLPDISGGESEIDTENKTQQIVPEVINKDPETEVVESKKRKVEVPVAKPQTKVESSEDETVMDLVPKKTIQKPLSNITNIRGRSQKCGQNRPELICVDFWESYDPDEVCSTGFGVIGTAPFTVPRLCFLCGSAGNEKMLVCSSCCEWYHSWCAEDAGRGAGGGEWTCARCVACAACSRSAARLRCRSCARHHHAACLVPAPPDHRSDWPQICSACLKCKSCDSNRVNKFVGSLPFCRPCFKLRQKGNYCPLCQACYRDNDFDSKMMECGWCARWVHASCEGLSGEGYQLLSALPPSIEYICCKCMPHDPPWRKMLTEHLKTKLLHLLKQLAKNKKACALLKLTPHKNTPVPNKPYRLMSPQAIRKLHFDTGDESMKTTETKVYRNMARGRRNNPSQNKFDDTNASQNVWHCSSLFTDVEMEKEDMPHTSHKVVNLQEPLMQNKEICFSTGLYNNKTEFTASCVEVHDNYPPQVKTEKAMAMLPTSIHDDKYEAISDDDEPVNTFPQDRSEQDLSPALIRQPDLLNEDASENDLSRLISPSLLDIKRRVNSDEYISLKDFNHDMKDVIVRTSNDDLQTIYKELFFETFPWFDCDNNCLQPNLEVEGEQDDTESLKDHEMSDNKGVNTKEQSVEKPLDQIVPKLESEGMNAEEDLLEFYPIVDSRTCVLCKVVGDGSPAMEGRLLYCGQNDWIHANCALWSAEVFEEIDGSLQNVHSAISRGKMIKCASCEVKGASVGCCAKNCSETYHYSCARKDSCAFMDDKRVFCPTHGKDIPKKSLQKDADFELTRPVYVELDKKKKRYSEISKVQFLMGSLTVHSLGKIVPSVSDYEEFLMPVDFSCSRLFWSCKKPSKIVRYTIKTKLILAEPLPGYDFGVNITVDHTMDVQIVERAIAEIGAWHQSLETRSKTVLMLKKDKSPIKFGNSVTLEDLAVKQVIEHLLDNVCKQEQQDEEEPQNTADLLPPEVKDAIFEDLNHDLLDGISMQDIFPKLMSYEDLVAMDLKNEFYGAMSQSDDKSDSRSTDFIDELLNARLESGNKELKRSKSEMLLQNHNLKSLTTGRGQQRSTSLTWNNKFDTSLLSSTIKRCKIGKSSTVTGKLSPVQRVALTESTLEPIKESEGSSNIDKKNKLENVANTSNICEEAPHTSGVNYRAIATTPKPKDDNSNDKTDKSEGYYPDVIDFYTKIQCSPISQLDGAADWSGSESTCSSRPSSPRDEDFTPIQQLDGAEDHTGNDNMQRNHSNQFLYRASGTESTYTVTIAGNAISGQPELVMRPLDDNSGASGQLEQLVRCDRCQCTYRNKESYDRHVPSCDMISTSESESENPKSPENRTLTTLQNAFQGAFAQPMIIHAGVVSGTENSVKAEGISARRTSINTRQITINGTIVETPSPGPTNEMTMTITEQMKSGTVIFDQSKTTNVQVSANQQVLSSPQIVVTPQMLLPPKTSTTGGQKMMTPQIITQPGLLPYNICVKPGNGNANIQQIQGSADMTQLLSGAGGIQVISSNSNQVLTIPSNQTGNITPIIQGKNQVTNFPNMASASSIALPVNSIQGMPNSSIIQNIQPMIRPQIQGNPTIVVPAMTAQRLTSPNSQKQQIILPGTPQKSPKKQPPHVQPKPIFHAANRGRGRPMPKPTTIKRQTKLEKTFTTINQSPLGPGNTVIQLQTNNQTGQPSIIVQPVANQNIMSAYVEALSQQQNQNMQYIATIAPQNDFKTAPTQFISQGGLMPQTFQIQQTENGGLVAVPSGGIPVLLPQGNVGILPQTIQQGATILPQGTIQAQGIISQGPNGHTILPQAIHTQNGTTIIPQGTIQGLAPGTITSQTATLLPNNTLQTAGATVVPQSGIGNGQTTIIPNGALPSQGNTLISSTPGATIIPQGTLLPQFCNDQVLLGSTPTLEMVTDPSGCMYLTTTQPVYYGLETIVQNTVMSSQQFVSTAMQGVLAQNSSFSATTTQVFQASKIEPIVEVPTGYVVVNNVGESVSSQAASSTPNVVTAHTVQSTPQTLKTVKTSVPNITLQPLPDKQSNNNNRQTPKVIQMSAAPITVGSQSGIGNLMTGRQSVNPITSQIHGMSISNSVQNMQKTNMSKPNNITMSPNVTLVSSTGQPLMAISQSIPNSGSSFSMQSIPLSQPIVSSSIAPSSNKNNIKIENSHVIEISGNLQDNSNCTSLPTISVTQSIKSPTPWRLNQNNNDNKIELQNISLKSNHTTNNSGINVQNNLSGRHISHNEPDKINQNCMMSIQNNGNAISSGNLHSHQFESSLNVSHHSSSHTTSNNVIQITAGNIYPPSSVMNSNFNADTTMKLSKINALSKTEDGHLNFNQEIMASHSQQHSHNDKAFQNIGNNDKHNSEGINNQMNIHKLSSCQVAGNMGNSPSISIIPHVIRPQMQNNQNPMSVSNNGNQMCSISNNSHGQVQILNSASNSMQNINMSCQEAANNRMNNSVSCDSNMHHTNQQHDISNSMLSNSNLNHGNMTMMSHDNNQHPPSNQIHIMNGQIQHNRQLENNQMQAMNQGSSNRSFHDNIIGTQQSHNQNMLSNRSTPDNNNLMNQSINMHNISNSHSMNRSELNDLNHLHMNQTLTNMNNMQNNRMMMDNMQSHAINNMNHQMHSNRPMDNMHNQQMHSMQQMSHHMNSSSRQQMDNNMHMNQQNMNMQQNRQIDNMHHHQHPMSNVMQIQNNRQHIDSNMMNMHQHVTNQMHNRQQMDNSMGMHHMSGNTPSMNLGNNMDNTTSLQGMHTNRHDNGSMTMQNLNAMNQIQNNRNSMEHSSLMQHHINNMNSINNMNMHNNINNSMQITNSNHQSMSNSLMHGPNIPDIKNDMQNSCSGSCSNNSQQFTNSQSSFEMCSNINSSNNLNMGSGNMIHGMNVNNSNLSNNMMMSSTNNSMYGANTQNNLTGHDMLMNCNNSNDHSVNNLMSGNNNHMIMNNSQPHSTATQHLGSQVPNNTQINISSCSLSSNNSTQNINNMENPINRPNVNETPKFQQEPIRGKNIMGPPPNPNVPHNNISNDCAKVNIVSNDKQNHAISVNNQLGYMQMNSQNNRVINLPERNRLNNTNIENNINTHVPQQHNIRVVTNNSNSNVGGIAAEPSLGFQQKTENNSTMINVPFQAIPNSAPMNINVNSSNNTVNITVQNNLVDPKIASKAAADISFPLQSNSNLLQTQNSSNSNMICIPVQQNSTISLPSQNSTSITLPKAPPTQQSGIPTNVVNPMSMRPMNRVLPLHRDGQSKSSKAAGTSKTPSVPKHRPATQVSQDMPDLSVKEETIDSDLEKAIEESKRMLELERAKREKEERDAARAIQVSTKMNQATTSGTSSASDIRNNEPIVTVGQMASLPSLDSDMDVEPPKVLTEKDTNRSLQSKMTNAPTKLMKRPLNDKKTESETTVTKKQNKLTKGQENKTAQPKQAPDPPKDDGPKLIYEVTSEDGFSYSSASLTDLWSKVIEAVQNARKQSGMPLIQYNLPSTLSGAHLLGLNNNALRYLIEQLPGASRCTKYKIRQGRPLSSWDNNLDLSEGFKESPWGSARTGPVARKQNHDMFSWMASPFREEPPPFGGQESESLISRRLATLPPAMRFRQLKETSKASVGVYRSHIHGRGLFCKRDIEEGDMVIEYAGEVIRAVLADQREKRYEATSGRRGVGGCYMFRIDDNLVVDATLKGNAARFINHSCDPNCYSRVVDIHGHKHILIFALRRITVGEELTYDYKFPFEEVKIPCTCGAKKCRKYLN